MSCVFFFFVFFLDGMAAADPSSDWNAPVEHWGNYEEVVVMPAPPPKEQTAPNKVSLKIYQIIHMANVSDHLK